MKPISLAVALVVLGVSCGGGGGDGGGVAVQGGISGTGKAVGTITGFGSIFVNGIEWETAKANILIANNLTTEDQLQLGMKVIVEGTFGLDGLTGVARNVSFDADLEGPISQVTPLGNDAVVKELVILGQRAIIEVGVTVFDDSDPTFRFDTLAAGINVQVSGLNDASGSIRATHIQKKPPIVVGVTPVQLRGAVANFDGTSVFQIGTITVSFDPSGENTDLTEIPGGIDEGLPVEVRGVLDAPDQVFATRFEIEEGLGDNIGQVDLEGFIADFNGLGAFQVGGQRVNALEANLIPNDPALFRDGARIDVDGSILNGILIAKQLELRDSNVKIHARIADMSDVDFDNDTIFLLRIPIKIDRFTRFRDDFKTPGFGLAVLEEGDFLEVRGFDNGSQGIVATDVRRAQEDDDVILQGPVESFDESARTITILGVTVKTDSRSEFEDAQDIRFQNAADFFRELEVGDVVKVKDKVDSDNTFIDIADEVEFED